MSEDYNKYKENYSDDSFWNKIKEYAIKIGKEGVEQSLILYYILKDPNTPISSKTMIMGALGYLILPIDIIPDLLPMGFTDDFAALALVYKSVSNYATEEHKNKAKNQLKEWFS